MTGPAAVLVELVGSCDARLARWSRPRGDAALEGVKDYNTGMLCQGYTYGTYPEHIPNNMDYTVTPDNGKFVEASTGGGCTLISASDPQIAAYRAIAGTAPMAS